jgi:hypothetical protein
MLVNAHHRQPITVKMVLTSSVLWVTRGSQHMIRKQRMVHVSNVLLVSIALIQDLTHAQMATFALNKLKMPNKMQLQRVQ